MSSQKPTMYLNRDFWERVEQGLTDGIWKIIDEGDFDTFKFGLMCPSTKALVMYQPRTDELKILQRRYEREAFERMTCDFIYRRQFKNQGWKVWFLRDVKDYSQSEPTLNAQLWVAEGHNKFLPDLDLDQDYQTDAKSGYTMAELMQAARKTCNMSPPTPAPANLIGNCQYYQWRYDDFVKRHNGCDHLSPPDYYLSYGAVFCKLFSAELYGKMSTNGKVWITKTRSNLQIDMEAFLKADLTIEFDNHKFYEKAFDSHKKAYLDAGFLNLSENDVVQFLDVSQFLLTLSQFDYVGHLARQQTKSLGKMYFDLHKNDHSFGRVGEFTSESVDLAKAWNGSFADWLHAHSITYLDILL